MFNRRFDRNSTAIGVPGPLLLAITITALWGIAPLPILNLFQAQFVSGDDQPSDKANLAKPKPLTVEEQKSLADFQKLYRHR